MMSETCNLNVRKNVIFWLESDKVS